MTVSIRYTCADKTVRVLYIHGFTSCDIWYVSYKPYETDVCVNCSLQLLVASPMVVLYTKNLCPMNCFYLYVDLSNAAYETTQKILDPTASLLECGCQLVISKLITTLTLFSGDISSRCGALNTK